MHPFLLHSDWFVRGRFFDPDGTPARAGGTAVVRPSADFPEVLEVRVELREDAHAGRSPQESRYHLELTPGNRVSFRMDSTTLGALLLGQGVFTDRSLTLSYLSHDRRFVGFESFTALDDGCLVACGCFIADSALVKSWEVVLEPVSSPGRRPRSV